jgi:hypothetical protein
MRAKSAGARSSWGPTFRGAGAGGAVDPSEVALPQPLSAKTNPKASSSP